MRKNSVIKMIKSALTLSFFISCSSNNIETVKSIDFDRFMGKWYVIAGRVTFMEEGAFNPTEIYTWNQKKEQIDIEFYFNKDSLDGEIKHIDQTGWIENYKTKAHWKVSPFWPLKFDYLVVANDEDYQWTAIGVPSQKYLWIMVRDLKTKDEDLKSALQALKKFGYDISELEYFDHSPIN